MLIQFNFVDALIGLGALVMLLPFLWRWKHKFAYLLFFAIFWVYLLALTQFAIFPIAISPNTGEAIFTPSINLVPFYFGSCFKNMPGLCMRTLLENILLTVPFGFGINFLTRVRARNFTWLAIAIGIGFEASQLIISLIVRNGFRAVDINDAILNAAGVLIGYALFRLFARIYMKTANHFGLKSKWLLADIYEVTAKNT